MSGQYFCNACNNFTPTALRKGSGWIELILYLFYIIPGIIYSVWRRSGEPTVCPICKAAALVPAATAKPRPVVNREESVNPREERDCPYCAERILIKAKVCKHCGREITKT